MGVESSVTIFETYFCSDLSDEFAPGTTALYLWEHRGRVPLELSNSVHYNLSKPGPAINGMMGCSIDIGARYAEADASLYYLYYIHNGMATNCRVHVCGEAKQRENKVT